MADQAESGSSQNDGGVSYVDDTAVKIICLGDSAVGKSKLVERFLMGQFQPQQLSTYALTLFKYTAEVEGKEVPVVIWDTAGQERFNTIHPSYYYKANACILCFDVTRKITYKNLSKWYDELQNYRKDIPTILVGNKIDVDVNATNKNLKFASKHNIPFYFTSAADGTNVVRIFQEAIKKGLEDKETPADDFYSEVMELINEPGFEG